MIASRTPEEQENINGSQCDEDSAVFCFELLVKVVLQNRSVVAIVCFHRFFKLRMQCLHIA